MDELLKKMKDEITTDPEGRGYAGKTDIEIMDLLNQPYTVDQVVQIQKPARIHEVLVGVANTPNVIKATDVNSAKKVS